MQEITSPEMAEEVGVLLAYAASVEKAALEYSRYIEMPDMRLFGMWEGGRLAGCIGIECLHPQALEIKHIAVAPTQRGRGIGKALVKAVRKELTPNVIVAETDGEAVGFYRSLGFEIRSLGEKYPGVERFRCRCQK
ncbi:GNAT family N-acetyltransferase [Planococcus chinensis]|uniref:GNAT family N-acetyltransferase n=1 Tax=Planococcus chinensis TaxID=272917 RepID=A0ABW4QCQ2_9BACL